MRLSARPIFMLGLVVPLGLVAFAVILTTIHHVAACPLCIAQRMLYLTVSFAALIGIVGLTASPVRIPAALAMSTASLAGATIAGYQIYMQRNPFSASCGDGTAWWERLVEQAGQMVPFLFRADGLCSDTDWTFLGLSIVEWSLLCFGGLFALGLLAVFSRLPQAVR